MPSDTIPQHQLSVSHLLQKPTAVPKHVARIPARSNYRTPLITCVLLSVRNIEMYKRQVPQRMVLF
jgi:hypothetical protein